MRKRELVAALEAALGFEPLPPEQDEAPPQPPAPADA